MTWGLNPAVLFKQATGGFDPPDGGFADLYKPRICGTFSRVPLHFWSHIQGNPSADAARRYDRSGSALS